MNTNLDNMFVLFFENFLTTVNLSYYFIGRFVYTSEMYE